MELGDKVFYKSDDHIKSGKCKIIMKLKIYGKDYYVLKFDEFDIYKCDLRDIRSFETFVKGGYYLLCPINSDKLQVILTDYLRDLRKRYTSRH